MSDGPSCFVEGLIARGYRVIEYDLAADAVGALDALGIEKAHIVGGSLGGMVAQVIAAEHPDSTLSLTSISSSTGNPSSLLARRQR